MMPAERRRHIRQDIEEQGAGRIKELSDKYDVSEMTIRRDLKTLEEEGHVRRTHGGAVRLDTTQVEPHYAAKQKLHAAQKLGIAQYAVDALVDDGDIILLEGGSTATAMARRLTDRKDLTIVTNGLHTMNELQHLLSHHEVICCGGILREDSHTFVGPMAEHFFGEFHARTVFLSASGWTEKVGFTNPNMLETQVKKAMCASAIRVVMLLDASKFGLRSLSTILPTSAVDVLVTDEEAPSSALQTLRDQGVDVRIAPSPAARADGRQPAAGASLASGGRKNR